MKATINKILLSLFVLLTTLAHSVENSIISTMENFESIENIPARKFTKNQLQEISSALEKSQEKIRLVTYNMLFNLYDHDLEEENRWESRLPRIVELIHEMKADIICTQELYPTQVKDLGPLVSKDFSFFPGQKDEDGESYGIFYRTDRFELLSSQVIYPLSAIELKDLKTDKILRVFNTHMPLSNIEKRELHAHRILEIIEPFAKETAVIFTGDLNTFPARLTLTKLPFYDGDYIHKILSKGSVQDSYQLSLLGHFGPISTFTSDGINAKPFQGTGTPGIILDYIYASKDRISVLTHATDPATVDGHFPSDHMPVLIDFIILEHDSCH